jgi:hypothetical protein
MRARLMESAWRRLSLLKPHSSVGPLLPPAIPLRPVLDLGLLHRLPLHVRRNIRTTTFEWRDVIDNVSFPAFGIPGLLHELTPVLRQNLIRSHK